MIHPRTSRGLLIRSLVTAMVGMVALSGWLLWPVGQRYWAVRQLVKAGEAKAPDRFLDAVAAIDKLPAGAAVADDLLALAKHPDDGVRTCAIIALGAFRSRPNVAVPVLVAVLDDANEAELARCAAAAALSRFAEDARPAVPSLIRAVVDYNNSLQDNPSPPLADLHDVASDALLDLGIAIEISGSRSRQIPRWRLKPRSGDASAKEVAEYLLGQVEPDYALGRFGVDTRHRESIKKGRTSTWFP